eukprot:6218236-Amphidinium_carterae.1
MVCLHTIPFSVEVAKAHAALNGRDVLSKEDLQLGCPAQQLICKPSDEQSTLLAHLGDEKLACSDRYSFEIRVYSSSHS